MKKIILFLFISYSIFAQKTPEDFGYRHLVYSYKKGKVDVIIKSKFGEESIAKPLFFWCQGSLPQPIIKYNSKGMFGTFPFNVNDFLDNYHIVIIGKPGIPTISDVKDLKQNYCFLTDDLKIPKEYSDSNYLDFYTKRNNFIIKKLLKEKWVAPSKLVVAGHSEGSYIAVNMASSNKKITHLIYSGGNPYGRFLNILAEDIHKNKNYEIMDYWKSVIENKNNANYTGGDTPKNLYQFSKPIAPLLVKLKIPVLISFGTKDWNAPYNDLFYSETIRKNITSITFKPYIDLEHNYFPTNEKLEPNYEIYNWENVGKDWSIWLQKNN